VHTIIVIGPTRFKPWVIQAQNIIYLSKKHV